jgi:hypothetical protein
MRRMCSTKSRYGAFRQFLPQRLGFAFHRQKPLSLFEDGFFDPSRISFALQPSGNAFYANADTIGDLSKRSVVSFEQLIHLRSGHKSVRVDFLRSV